MGSDVKASLERFYVSTSMLEIRMSELTHGTDRLPYITILYMDLIGFNPGITSSQIAEMLGVTKATVTSTVNRLVEKGYVVRERSEDDGRVRNLRLSDRTMEDYRMESRLFGRASAMFGERYSPEEVAMFCEMMDSLSEFLDACGSDPEGSGDREGDRAHPARSRARWDLCGCDPGTKPQTQLTFQC